MRIRQLRLKNLNSLAGDWAIDFTHPDYQAQGLFAITGPTGAGKTTILDAICLALYGETPRLGPITQSSNEIMSRRTGECSAELTFETQAGRFRAHWSQRRAQKKAEGKLQEPRHEIVDDHSGRVIESARRKTLAAVESITGMNFGQFTRAMMLAQGAFAAFLEAPADERADLLERITGTDAYSALSIEAHRRRGEERGKKENLERQLAGLNSEDDEKALAAELEAAAAALSRAEAALDRAREAAAWLKKLAELSADQAALLEREGRLARELTDFEPQARRLEEAARARRGDERCGQLKMLRAQRERTAAALAGHRRALPELEKAAAAAGAALAAAEEAALLARKKEADSRPGLNEARDLDLKLRENDRRRAPLADRLAKIAAEFKAAARGLFETERREAPEGPGRAESPPHDLPSWSRKLADVKDELAARRERAEARRRNLAELLAGRDLSAWRDDRLNLSRRGDGLAGLAADLAGLAARRKEARELEADRQKTSDEQTAVSAELQAAQEKLLALEREAVHLAARWDLQQRLRSLEAHRADLVDGEPCPLCGAREHPYADPQNRPAEEVTTDLLAASRAVLEAARKNITALTARESGLAQRLAGNRLAADKLAGELAALEKNVEARRTALGVEFSPDAEWAVQLEALTRRLRRDLEAAEKTVRAAEETERELAEIDRDRQKRTEACQAAERLLRAAAEVRAELDILDGEGRQFRRARGELFGGQAADEAEKSLRAEVEKSGAALEQARRAALAGEAAREKRQTVIAETESSLKALEGEIKAHTEAFQAAVQALGFADEAAWLAAGLAEEERAALEKRAGQLSEERAGLAAKRADNAARLAAERDRRLTAATLPEVEGEIKQGEADRSAGLEKRALLSQKLADCRRAGEKRLELKGQLAAQDRECRRWDRLHELIGSADGKKFRNFAQGLTFEMMVRMANRQLVRLSDRYLLTRDAARPLELKVADHYQAGEIRSTKNLSGGESFLVSLALALGLSQMTSRKVRVDSLFLDEGFGSLDEETLETALDALAGLNEEGKLIGLISHVPALTGRLAVQVKVRPLNGPHSRLSGPGVGGDGADPEAAELF